MTKEQIIKSAKEKGFTSKVLFNNPYKYSHNEDMRWLFWLTELQKWFRDVNNIDITIRTGTYNGVKIYHFSLPFHEKEFNWNRYDTYEEALEAGCVEALNLI